MSILKTVTHPLLLAAAGGYGGHRWQGKKHPALSVVGGAAAGLLAGYLLQRFVLPPPLTGAVTAGQQPQPVQGNPDDFFLGAPPAQTHQQPGDVEYAEVEEDYGVPSGSLGEDVVDEDEIDELVAQAAAMSN